MKHPEDTPIIQQILAEKTHDLEMTRQLHDQRLYDDQFAENQRKNRLKDLESQLVEQIQQLQQLAEEINEQEILSQSAAPLVEHAARALEDRDSEISADAAEWLRLQDEDQVWEQFFGPFLDTIEYNARHQIAMSQDIPDTEPLVDEIADPE